MTDSDKPAIGVIAAQLHDLGFSIVATGGTAGAIARMGIPVERLNKIQEGSPHVVDWIERGDVDLVINTPTGTAARTDGYEIRRAAIARGVPCITTITGGMAAARAIAVGAHRDAGRCARCRSCTAPTGRRRSRERGKQACPCEFASRNARRPDARAVRAPAAAGGRRARRHGAVRRARASPTRTGRRPTRASSRCSPPPSAGAAARTSGRSCRARSPSRGATAAAGSTSCSRTSARGPSGCARCEPGDDVWLLGPLGRGFAPPRGRPPAACSWAAASGSRR